MAGDEVTGDEVRDDEVATRRRSTLVIAWSTALLLSTLPQIVLREGFGLTPEWLPWALVGVAGLLWLVSNVLARLRPLRGYFTIMAVFWFLVAVFELILRSATWRALVPASLGEVRILLAQRALLAALALIFIGMLIVLGTRPADAYLLPGQINARSSIRLPGQAGYLRWTIAGPLWIVILILLTGLGTLALGSMPSVINLGAALPLIALAALAAALNSFWEEVAYRAAPLSQLAPVIGESPAVLLLAIWFGIGHYYGIPSGPVGVVIAAATGLLFGRAMIETRGLAWPWALHFTIDLVIFVVIALA